MRRDLSFPRPLLLLTLGLAGCPATEDFEVLVTDEPSGVLLSAHSDGDTLMAVGGQLDGSAGTMVQGTGDSWCRETLTDQPLWWLHGDGAGAGNWTATGAAGTVLRSEGGTVTDETLPLEDDDVIYGVWVDGDTEWAVGGDPFGDGEGFVWKRSGGAWAEVEAGLPGVLFKVWEDWIVGNGVVYRIEGDALVDVTPPGAPNLRTVRGRSSDDVWAVGGDGNSVIVHWDGSAWTEVDVDPYCGDRPLNGVWTAPGEDVWVTGFNGVMARFDGTDWTCADSVSAQEHYHAVWPHGDDVWFFGGNLTRQVDNVGHIARYGLGTSEVVIGDCE
ncbi:MAG: hypothetical protein KDA24_11600 [Deltaproteobacteria bacterium]|nr:hypothetical protein [Deltaproteobacteria bacterium]